MIEVIVAEDQPQETGIRAQTEMTAGIMAEVDATAIKAEIATRNAVAMIADPSPENPIPTRSRIRTLVTVVGMTTGADVMTEEGVMTEAGVMNEVVDATATIVGVMIGVATTAAEDEIVTIGVGKTVIVMIAGGKIVGADEDVGVTIAIVMTAIVTTEGVMTVEEDEETATTAVADAPTVIKNATIAEEDVAVVATTRVAATEMKKVDVGTETGTETAIVRHEKNANVASMRISLLTCRTMIRTRPSLKE